MNQNSSVRLKTIVFTVCTPDQYPFVKVLAESLPAGVYFKIGTVAGTLEKGVSFADLGHSEVASMQQRYDATALAAASKPFFADYFLQKEQADAIVYFDPTIWWLGDWAEIEAQLQNNEVVLTPRLTRTFGQSSYGDEKLFLNTGMYDAGFWAMKATDNTRKLLKWWQERLTDRAYFDVCNGMNHDQLWLNYIPIYFDKVTLNKNLGWNVALHNLHERIITSTSSGWRVNQETPLIFFNFRESLSNKIISQYAGALALQKAYLQRVQSHGEVPVSPFSVRTQLRPTVPAWKQSLRQSIQSMIDSIRYFPLYHKIDQ